MKRFIPFIAKDPVVSVVTLSGVIAASNRSGTLSDSALAPAIERAFAKGKPAAVALVLNSPGGSPAQSSLIAGRIRRLADEKKIPVHAFVEDVAASGGYWLACAADDIWIDASSVVGSIGVISAGFGLHEAIARIGVERRVYTSGKDKSMLDPFRPERAEDVERLKGIHRQIHEAFIAHVKARRGARLVGGDDLFTGEFWVGQRGVDLGLADGLGHIVPKLKELYGDKVRFQRFGPRRGLFQRFGASLSAELTGGIEASIEDRALWSRYGLT
ncbi:S49 family peptidase [Roseicyclus mahoneyensis]|uniref:Serine protease SohB n=1 Tax=Roseicyclus mahoneyensis TaxID=164332 RepID=A0A316GG53_9RHOB|nr:S49 family peptidase [Roseicyclus mahoneyensis]PWK59905.1 serine protease SohB [Roseicyclus mahoneyensis]